MLWYHEKLCPWIRCYIVYREKTSPRIICLDETPRCHDRRFRPSFTPFQSYDIKRITEGRSTRHSIAEKSVPDFLRQTPKTAVVGKKPHFRQYTVVFEAANISVIFLPTFKNSRKSSCFHVFIFSISKENEIPNVRESH